MAFDPVTAVLELGKALIPRLFPDKEKAAEATIKLTELHKSGDLATLVEESNLDKAYLQDRQDARKRDTEYIKATGKRNYRPDIMFVLAILVTCGLVYVIWKDPTINEYIKGIFTLVIGRFLGYLDNIYNFEFGSTRSSKDKDTTISKLTGK